MEKKPVKDLNSLDDKALLEAVARKDVQAFSFLYERHSPKLFGLAIHILKDSVLAEDVLQDIFLAIWKNARSFDAARGTATTWLVTLCRNRCIDKLRAMNNKNQRTSLLSEEIIARLEAVRSERPDEVAQQNAIKAMIGQALRKLPEEQQSLIDMAYFGGMSQSEIASELDLPLGTVKTRIRLGMQKLRALVKSEK